MRLKSALNAELKNHCQSIVLEKTATVTVKTVKLVGINIIKLGKKPTLKKGGLRLTPGEKQILKDGKLIEKPGGKLIVKKNETHNKTGNVPTLKNVALIAPGAEQPNYKQPRRGRISQRYRIST